MLCILERGVDYTIYVKNKKYVRTKDVTCNTLGQGDNIGKKTVSMTCYKPLSGKYLEIYSSKNTLLKVFEIQYFGMFYLTMNLFLARIGQRLIQSDDQVLFLSASPVIGF